jgi:damage-control phosphatase, subfamily I
VAALKMASNCYPCILDRAKFESDLVFQTDAEKKAAVEELLDFMASHKGGVPALVGTQRELIIKRRCGRPDPYEELKRESNLVATGLLPVARQFFEESDNKIEAMVRIAAAANSMEFGVKGHDYDNSTFGLVFASILHEKLEGDLEEVERRLKLFQNIFYLTDNTGEIIFDLFVIEKLRELGKMIVIGSKSEPILNDVTAEEVRNMSSNPVLPTGAVVGTTLEDIGPEASKLLFDPDWLVISKGMGNFETMSEFDEMLKGRLIYVFRAKCEPVAMKIGVPKGTLVVKSI